jgi:hypothetical protein
MLLSQQLDTLLEQSQDDLLEARRDAYREIKKIMGQDGGKLFKYGLYGVRVGNRAWAGLKKAIERAGGSFDLKAGSQGGGQKVGHVTFNGHKFGVLYEPDAYPGEGDLISISDGDVKAMVMPNRRGRR